MNSTGRLKFNCRPLVLAALALLSALAAFTPVRAADNPMPRPAELERDVQFWIRIYTEFDTNAGVLHDQYNLGVVYKALHFAPDTPAHERQHEVDSAREALSAALRRIADSGDGPLSPEDQQIKDLWGAEATPARLRAATEDIRFQLGRSAFRAGLIRSGAWGASPGRSPWLPQGSRRCR
jgi:membrane-bound lytic murein transglycosylase D